MAKAIKDLVGIGKPIFYTVKLGETLAPGKVFPNHVFFELSQVNLENDETIIFPEPRRFVPTFDSTESRTTQILAWSNKDESVLSKESFVLVKSEINTVLDFITAEGEGYVSLEVRAWEYEPDVKETATEE